MVIRNHPELRDKPVAVCHSDNTRGTAEISSANYPARDYGLFSIFQSASMLCWGVLFLCLMIACVRSGVRAGIFVRDDKALCPHLVIFPYDF